MEPSVLAGQYYGGHLGRRSSPGIADGSPHAGCRSPAEWRPDLALLGLAVLELPSWLCNCSPEI